MDLIESRIRMDILTPLVNNPGLQHIGHKILMLLDDQSLLNCKRVSQSWKKFLDNPRFWLNKCVKADLFIANGKKCWTNLIQILEEECLLRLEEDCLKGNCFHEKCLQGITSCLMHFHIKSPITLEQPERTLYSSEYNDHKEYQFPLHTASR